MESLMPSEIARLVLGYLKEEGCQDSYNAFLRESPHLVEYAGLLKAGREYSTKVGNMRLQDILDKHTEGHRTEGKAMDCNTNERPDESNKGEHSKPCKHFSPGEQPQNTNAQKSPVRTTAPASTAPCLATPVKSTMLQPFRDFKSPRRKSHAPKRRSVEPNQLVVEKPVDVAPAPSTVQYQSDPGVSNDSTVSEPMLLEEMLSNTHFAEILADNINKVVVQQEESQHAKPAAPQPSERPPLDPAVTLSLAGTSDRTATMQSLGLHPIPPDPARDEALPATATEPSASDVLDRILEETPMTDNAINGIIEMTKNDPSFDALFNLFKVGPTANSTGNTTEGTLSTPTYSKEFFGYDDALASSGDFTPTTKTSTLLGGAVRTTAPNDADNLVSDTDFSFCEVDGVASTSSADPSRVDSVQSSSFVSVGDATASYNTGNDSMVPLASISGPQFTTIDDSAISAVNSVPGNRCSSTVLTVAAPAGTVSVWPGQQLPTLTHSSQSTPSPDFTTLTSPQPLWKMTTKSTRRGQRKGVNNKLNVGAAASVASEKKKRRTSSTTSATGMSVAQTTSTGTSPANTPPVPAAEPVNSFAILTSALTSPSKLQINPALKSCEKETLPSTQATLSVKRELCAKEVHLVASEITKPRSVQLIKPAPATKVPVILTPLCNRPLGTLTNKRLLPATKVTTPLSVVLLPAGSSVKDTVGKKRKRTPRNPQITISKKRQVLGIPGKCLPESSVSTVATSTSTSLEVQAAGAQLKAKPAETKETKLEAKQLFFQSPVLLDDSMQNECASSDNFPSDPAKKPQHLSLVLKPQVEEETRENMIVATTKTALKSLARIKSPARRLSSVISETLPTSTDADSSFNSQHKSPQKGGLRCAYKPGAAEPSPGNTPRHSSTLASSPAIKTPDRQASSQKLQSLPKTDTGVAIRATGSLSKTPTNATIFFASQVETDGKSFTRKLSFEDTLHSDTNSPMLTIDLSNGFSPVGPNVLSAPNSQQPSQVETGHQNSDCSSVVEGGSQPKVLACSETEVETNPCTQEHSKQCIPNNSSVPNLLNTPKKTPHKNPTLRKMLEDGEKKQETDLTSNSFNDSISPNHKSRKKKKRHKRHNSEDTFTCARTRGWQKRDKATKSVDDTGIAEGPDMAMHPPSPQHDAGHSLVPDVNNSEGFKGKTASSETGATCSSAAIFSEPAKTPALEGSHNDAAHCLTELPDAGHSLVPDANNHEACNHKTASSETGATCSSAAVFSDPAKTPALSHSHKDAAHCLTELPDELSPVSVSQDRQHKTKKDNNQSQIVDSLLCSTSLSQDITSAAPQAPFANELSSHPPQSSTRATTNGNTINQALNSPRKEQSVLPASSASNPASTLPPVALAVDQSKEAEVAEALVCFAEKAVITPKSERPSLVSITNIDFVPNFETLMPVRKLYTPATPPKFILTDCCTSDNKMESSKDQVVDTNLCPVQGDKKIACTDVRDTTFSLETSNGSETKATIPGMDVKKKLPRRIVPIKLDTPLTVASSQPKIKTFQQPGLGNKPSNPSDTSIYIMETSSTASQGTVNNKPDIGQSRANPSQTSHAPLLNHAQDPKTPTKLQPQPSNHRITASPLRSNPLTKLLETIMTPPSPKKKARKRPCQPKTAADNPKKALASMDIEKFLAKLHSKKQQ